MTGPERGATAGPAVVQHLFGTAVASDLALARSAGPGAEAAGVPELELLWGPPLAVPDGPPPGRPLVHFELGGIPVYSAADAGSHYRLRVHGLCEFVVDHDLRRARCHADPSADCALVSLVARGAFFAFWLGLRGECVLHGAAVVPGRSAVAFVGDSGMGKSTLAGWACRRGARFVTDDLLRLDATGTGWFGRAPELRLRPGAGELLSGLDADWSVCPSADGRLTAVPPAVAGDAGTIGAVVVPRPRRDARQVVLERLDPLQGALALARFPRLLGWCSPGPLEAQFAGTTALADAAPVYVATIPWGPPFRAAVMDELLAAVSSEAPVHSAGGGT